MGFYPAFNRVLYRKMSAEEHETLWSVARSICQIDANSGYIDANLIDLVIRLNGIIIDLAVAVTLSKFKIPMSLVEEFGGLCGGCEEDEEAGPRSLDVCFVCGDGNIAHRIVNQVVRAPGTPICRKCIDRLNQEAKRRNAGRGNCSA